MERIMERIHDERQIFYGIDILKAYNKGYDKGYKEGEEHIVNEIYKIFHPHHSHRQARDGRGRFIRAA